jgi:U4/U6 small nuclear ribonucleoprotein PRP4
MSDDDEVIYAKRQKTIHYGTLEETMEARMKHMRNEPEAKEATAPLTTSITKEEYFDIEGEM